MCLSYFVLLEKFCTTLRWFPGCFLSNSFPAKWCTTIYLSGPELLWGIPKASEGHRSFSRWLWVSSWWGNMRVGGSLFYQMLCAFLQLKSVILVLYLPRYSGITWIILTHYKHTHSRVRRVRERGGKKRPSLLLKWLGYHIIRCDNTLTNAYVPNPPKQTLHS